MATLTVGDLTPRVQYTATASQTVFAYNFPIFQDSDLKVYIGSTLKTLTTDYTVSGAGGSSGGNVTLVSGASAGDIITIERDLPIQRTTDYQANGDLLAENLNDDLDKLTMMAQQNESNLARSIRQSVDDAATDMELPNASARASKIFAFDSSGDIDVTQEIGTYKGTDATVTTAAYVVRDLVKSTTASELGNVYICTAASPIGTLLTNTSYWSLIVDAMAFTSLVDDTTPQLGGNLDFNGNTVHGVDSTEMAILDGATVTTAELNILDGVTSTAAELNILDGVTSTAAELNILDGVTSTAAELNILDGVTSTAAELNILDGVTSTAAELNILDGVTSTTAELNQLDGFVINTTATSNIGLGTDAVDSITTGDYNVGLGDDVLTACDAGIGNTAVGHESAAITSGGDYNVSVGYRGMYYNTTGGFNTSVGYQALRGKTSFNTGGYNVAIGANTLLKNSTGRENVAIGYSASYKNEDGEGNVSIGNNALYTNVSGDGNIAIGEFALRYNDSSGGECVAVGTGSQENATDGWHNTTVGYHAGKDIDTGHNNLALGANAGVTGSPFTIDFADSDRIVLGDNSIVGAYIKVAWTVTSDERDKADITGMTHGLNVINNIKPINYVWDNRSDYWETTTDAEGNETIVKHPSDGSKKQTGDLRTGFSAQNIKAALDAVGYEGHSVVDSTDAEQLRLTESNIIPFLVNSIKELSAKIELLETQT